jgi:hypothetical protein
MVNGYHSDAIIAEQQPLGISLATFIIKIRFFPTPPGGTGQSALTIAEPVTTDTLAIQAGYRPDIPAWTPSGSLRLPLGYKTWWKGGIAAFVKVVKGLCQFLFINLCCKRPVKFLGCLLAGGSMQRDRKYDHAKRYQ